MHSSLTCLQAEEGLNPKPFAFSHRYPESIHLQALSLALSSLTLVFSFVLSFSSSSFFCPSCFSSPLRCAGLSTRSFQGKPPPRDLSLRVPFFVVLFGLSVLSSTRWRFSAQGLYGSAGVRVWGVSRLVKMTRRSAMEAQEKKAGTGRRRCLDIHRSAGKSSRVSHGVLSLLHGSAVPHSLSRLLHFRVVLFFFVTVYLARSTYLFTLLCLSINLATHLSISLYLSSSYLCLEGCLSVRCGGWN